MPSCSLIVPCHAGPDLSLNHEARNPGLDINALWDSAAAAAVPLGPPPGYQRRRRGGPLDDRLHSELLALTARDPDPMHERAPHHCAATSGRTRSGGGVHPDAANAEADGACMLRDYSVKPSRGGGGGGPEGGLLATKRVSYTSSQTAARGRCTYAWEAMQAHACGRSACDLGASSGKPPSGSSHAHGGDVVAGQRGPCVREGRMHGGSTQDAPLPDPARIAGARDCTASVWGLAGVLNDNVHERPYGHCMHEGMMAAATHGESRLCANDVPCIGDGPRKRGRLER